MRPWLGIVACATLAGQGAVQELPSFRSGVDIVQLDVSVLDKDRRPVRGLTADDFVITVDGTSQPIVAFDAVVMPPRETPTAPWMRDVAPDVKTNAFGAQVHSTADVVAADAFGKGRSAEYTCDLPLRTLPAGAYLLTIEARLGSITTRRDLRFSVR